VYFFEVEDMMKDEGLGEKRGGNRKKAPDPKSNCSNKFKLVTKPRLVMNTRISARGSGLCVYLPKDTCDLYGFIAGDILVTELHEHFREKTEDELNGQ
jgi:hypothetical protein